MAFQNSRQTSGRRAGGARRRESTQSWREKYRTIPVNHFFCVDKDLAGTRPDAIAEIFRMLKASKAAAPPPAVPVTMTRVQLKDVPLSVRSIGNVQAYQSVAIKSMGESAFRARA